MARPKKTAPTEAVAARNYQTIDVAQRNTVALVTLDRPDLHNAFDETLIAELTRALHELDRSPDVRAVVLLGAGRSFSAGADLNWMKRAAGYEYARNLEDARALARLLHTLATLSKPTIARVHGPAFGGGVGLVACCDIVFASHEATFALTEAKLGLIPATIGPYVVEAIGVRAARRYFVSTEKFDAGEAYRLGLVHELAPTIEALDERINELLGTLILAGPHAQAAAKALLRAIAHRPIDDALVADTAERIATLRATDEAREGIAAFLERRSPAWVPASLAKRKRT
jgi:methylglutaconyl-CoA hydratase